jgi:hypothetical protein
LGQSFEAQAASRSAQVIDTPVVIVAKAKGEVAVAGVGAADDVAAGADGVSVDAMIVCGAQALSTTDIRIVDKRRGNEDRMTPFYHASFSRHSDSDGSF